MQHQEKWKLFSDHRVINWHEHVWYNAKRELDEALCDGLIADLETFCHDMCVVSLPLLQQKVTAEEFRHANRTCAQALRKYPKQLRGFGFVNPGYIRETLDEIDRCVSEYGMIGVKLYYQYTICDPVMYPMIEKCIDLNIPILMHASKLNYHPWEQPVVSNGPHFAEIAKRYPEAKIIMAHIGGGGDWEYSLKAIADSPSILMDISGSVCEDQIIERSVKEIGAKRILYGTDGSFSACAGKLLGADIPYEDKLEIIDNKFLAPYLDR
ncbi:MAG: amidohydrolase [Clostridia bacterium]|nr:amidohydrolase [Clostridia bacterium]